METGLIKIIQSMVKIIQAAVINEAALCNPWEEGRIAS
jgi:hypothetical protein